MLKTYSDFLSYAEDVGVIAFFRRFPGWLPDTGEHDLALPVAHRPRRARIMAHLTGLERGIDPAKAEKLLFIKQQ